VAALVQRAVRTAAVTEPLSAALAAFKALGVRRIGLISPYVAEVSASLRTALAAAGVDIVAFASFEEQVEAKVARIAPSSIHDSVLAIGAQPTVDAVFVSCTNLKALGVLDAAERTLRKPVIASNQALAWHMARLAGIGTLDQAYGRLMAMPYR
jgi:maleate isomerase